MLAKLLVDELLGPDDWAGRVRFLSSGSEAVDQAMLIARLYTQRPIIVAFQHAFHGSTLGASGIGTRFRGYAGGLSSPEEHDLSADGSRLPAGRQRRRTRLELLPLPARVHASGVHLSVPGRSGAVPARLEELIRNLGPENVAALIAEPMSVTGVPNPPEYVRQIRELTTRLGILWIDDEIITGFGRTGTWFAYQWSGVTPDIMTIGKAFTENATIPMSATIVSREIADFFSQYPLDGPAAPAPAIRSLPPRRSRRSTPYRDEGLIERGQELGEYLGPKLRELAARHPCVGWVTGRGAFWSLELTKDATTREPFVPEGRDRIFSGNLSRLPGARVAAEAWRRGSSAARRPGDRAARPAVDRHARALRRGARRSRRRAGRARGQPRGVTAQPYQERAGGHVRSGSAPTTSGRISGPPCGGRRCSRPPGSTCSGWVTTPCPSGTAAGSTGA